MWLVALLFTMLDTIMALLLLVASVHGPSGLAVAAPLVLAASLALVWIAWARLRSRPLGRGFLLLVAAGVLSATIAPATFVVMEPLDRRMEEARIRATEVFEVRDEPLLSESGNTLGVRLSFKLRVSRRGFYSIAPSVSSSDPPWQSLYLIPQECAGDSDRIWEQKLDPRREYRACFELLPGFVARREGRLCRNGPLPEPAAAGSGVPLRLVISGTAFGQSWHGGREEYTRGRYDAGTIVRDIALEALPACLSPGGESPSSPR